MRTLTIVGDEGRFDEPSFTLSENANLELKIVFTESRIGTYHLLVKNGVHTLDFKVKDGATIAIPSLWLKGCKELEFSLAFRNRTDTVTFKNDYQIEPLKVKKVDGDFSFTGKVQALENRVLKVEEQMQTLALSQSELTERMDGYETDGIMPDVEIEE
ncbi:MAG: hypothetical protein IJY38_03285 [Clostridia bacterium]|nr:hypothetical protein [Clostridia bacterium]